MKIHQMKSTLWELRLTAFFNLKRAIRFVRLSLKHLNAAQILPANRLSPADGDLDAMQCLVGGGDKP